MPCNELGVSVSELDSDKTTCIYLRPMEPDWMWSLTPTVPEGWRAEPGLLVFPPCWLTLLPLELWPPALLCGEAGRSRQDSSMCGLGLETLGGRQTTRSRQRENNKRSVHVVSSFYVCSQMETKLQPESYLVPFRSSAPSGRHLNHKQVG